MLVIVREEDEFERNDEMGHVKAHCNSILEMYWDEVEKRKLCEKLEMITSRMDAL